MTASFDDSLGTPPLADAIDRHPLIVAPDTPLIQVVTLMYETARSHHRFGEVLTQPADAFRGARSSCVLVMQNEQLLGIFTERDLVQLTASEVSLDSTQIREVMHSPVLTMSEQGLHNVFAALFLFRRHRIRHLAIADEQRLVGVVSLDSIRHVLRPTNLLKIRRVAEVMTNQVTTALLTASVRELTKLMAAERISCVVIVHENELDTLPTYASTHVSEDEFDDEFDGDSNQEDAIQHPVGIVTERDIVRFQALGLDFNTTFARSVMSTPLFVLNPEDSLWTAHQEMEQRQVRRLVVSWNWGRRLGLVTQTSILRVFDPIEMHDVIETLQRTIQSLGLDLDKVLASAIDHDSQLAALHAPSHNEIPNFKNFLNALKDQIEYLLETPELPADTRQTVLHEMISELRQFQSLL